jgi:Flp pilus assembly pilin Flp
MRKLARALRSGGRGVGMVEYMIAAMVLIAVVGTGMALIGSKVRTGSTSLGNDIGAFKVTATSATNGNYGVNSGSTTINGIALQ